MAKRVATKRAIVVSANRPKIQIRHAGWFIRLTIPAYNRRTLALAHIVTASLYADIIDEQWEQLELVIGAGDHARTCTTIDITIKRELRAKFEARDGAQLDAIMRDKLGFLLRPLREATIRACTPLYGGERTYDIVEIADYINPQNKDV